MKNIRTIALTILFCSICLVITLPALSQQKATEDSSKKEISIQPVVDYLKDGSINEAMKTTSTMESIENLSEQDKKALFNGFYEGFVKLSKAFRLNDTEKLAAEWARLYPKEKAAVLYYASILTEKGNNVDAKDRFDIGFNLQEKYMKIDDALLNNFYNTAAGNSADREDWKKSIEYITKIEKRDKNYFNLGLLKCRAYYYEDKFKEGLKICDNVFKTPPKNASALDYVTYAGYYRKNKNYTKAIEIVMEALKKFPLADGLAMTVAADRIRLGEYYKAFMLCVREDMIAMRDYYSNKNIQELKQMITEAAAREKTVEAEKASKVLNILKMLNDKQYEDAIKLMDELNENTLIYREGLEIFRGEALESLGKYKEAESVYNYVISRDPTLIMAYCKLFELYMKKMDEKEKALEMFQKARKIKPDHWKVIQIEDWLSVQKK